MLIYDQFSDNGSSWLNRAEEGEMSKQIKWSNILRRRTIKEGRFLFSERRLQIHGPIESIRRDGNLITVTLKMAYRDREEREPYPGVTFTTNIEVTSPPMMDDHGVITCANYYTGTWTITPRPPWRSKKTRQ